MTQCPGRPQQHQVLVRTQAGHRLLPQPLAGVLHSVRDQQAWCCRASPQHDIAAQHFWPDALHIEVGPAQLDGVGRRLLLAAELQGRGGAQAGALQLHKSPTPVHWWQQSWVSRVTSLCRIGPCCVRCSPSGFRASRIPLKCWSTEASLCAHTACGGPTHLKAVRYFTPDRFAGTCPCRRGMQLQPLAALCGPGQHVHFTAGHSPKVCLHQHSMQQKQLTGSEHEQSCMQIQAAMCILSQWVYVTMAAV